MILGLSLITDLTGKPDLSAQQAKEMTVQLQTTNETNDTTDIYSEEFKGRIWVDAMKVAESLGAETSVANEVYFMDFSSRTFAVNSKTSVLGILKKDMNSRKKQKWVYGYMDHPIRVTLAERLLMPIDALPGLFNVSFSYHLQKRLLKVDAEQTKRSNGFRNVPVRHVAENQKIWISVQDLAKAVGAVQYTSQPNRYKLVLANFTILELAVGQNRIFKRNDTFAIIEDPVLLFSGSPYVTLSAIKPIFGVTAQWDADSKSLLIASAHEKDKIQVGPGLKIIGYQPEPFLVDMEELGFYYQDPAPLYSAAHDQVYESARNFTTNDVTIVEQPAWGKMSGTALPNVKGSVLGAPFQARGIFEKVGPESQLVNGNVQWGFPMLKMSAGREYITINNLNNQFDLVDLFSLSHSNDHYGDNNVNPQYNVKAFYGQTFFSVFMSSSLFSQTVDFRQQMGGTDFELNWMLPNHHRAGFSVEQYIFENKTEQVSSNIQEQDFLLDLFGDDLGVLITPQEQSTLTAKYLTDRHYTTVLDANYKIDRLMQANVTTGLSAYKDYTVNSSGEWVKGADYKLRNILGTQSNRVDVSYERVGAQYRSIGNPLRYQDKDILRMAPYLDVTKFWKLYGEYRREDSKILTGTSMPSFSNIYFSGGNFFNFEKNSWQLSGTHFESTLSGKRNTLGLNWTRYFGRDTMDLGGNWGEQKTALGTVFRKSFTGKAGYQILREDWRAGFSQELTQSLYDLYSRKRWEGISTLTFQWKSIKGLAQYEFKPKYFLTDTSLYTAYFRLGHKVRDNKSLNLFAALTSREASLKNPDIWRVGLEWMSDFRQF